MPAPLSLRFPMTRERTGNRRGPRFRRIPDKTGLSGAAACTAGMIIAAIHRRESLHSRSPEPTLRRFARLQMRGHALWARIFAGQVSQDDPRVERVRNEIAALVTDFCGTSQAAA